MKQQADRFGMRTVGEEVTAVDFTQDPKLLFTAFGEQRARSVVIATGARPRRLGALSWRKSCRDAACRTAPRATATSSAART